MRILHIIVGLGLGGAERSLVRLLQAHQGSSLFEHHVISLTGGGQLRDEVIRYSSSLVELRLEGFSSLVPVFIRLVSEIRRCNPDAIQCWMYHSDLLGGIAGKISGVNTIFWGVRNAHLEGTSQLKRVLRIACAATSWLVPTKIVCVAEEARRIHEMAGYAGHKMVVIPNGYDLKSLQFNQEGGERIRKLFGLNPSDIVVGSMGRFSPAKDHRGFLQAASMACAEDERLRFILIGRGIGEGLGQAVVDFGLADRVFMPGQVDHINDYLSAIDIFCMHSVTEGFPNALAEAMALERPCIATDVGDAGLMLAGIGRLVPKGDPVAMAGSIVQLASIESDARKSMGRILRQKISLHYSIENVISRYEKLYLSPE